MKFLDGPATGVVLCLSRAPVFIRAVQNKAGEWDALDQLDDTPRPDETIHVYRLAGSPTWMHVDGRDKQGRRFGRTTYHGEYRHFPEQPAPEEIRITEGWQAWVETQRLAGKAVVG